MLAIFVWLQQQWLPRPSLYLTFVTATVRQATHISGADLADKVTQRYQRMKANMESASNFMGKWTNADGSFKQAAFLQQLEQKIAAGVRHGGRGNKDYVAYLL